MAKARSDISSDLGGDYSVTLPVGQDQFREFLTGLLGKPQTITRRLHGPFKVTREDVEDVHVLLEQRLLSQNNAMLASFIARIVFDDNSSVQLNSFSEFKAYNEVKPLRSQTLHLSWTYLVQFQNKTQYEKQQIDLSISVEASAREVDIDAELRNYQVIRSTHRGAMSLRIAHSDRSWGGDIDSLLTGRLAHLKIEKQPVRHWLSDWSGVFGFATFATLFAMSIYATYYAMTRASIDYVAGLRALEAAPPSIENLSRAVTLLSKYVIGGGGELIAWGIIFVIVALVGSIAAGLIVSTSAEYYPRSFLLLTRADESDFQQSLTESSSHIWRFLGMAILSLFLGVVSNLLFYYLTKWWVLN